MDIATELKKLEQLLPHTETKDRYFLERDLKRAMRDNHREMDEALISLKERIVSSAERVLLRQKNVPKITYDDALPIAEKREIIKEALNEHQVVIVCGETGSGKTTQLAKMCLELGFGARGLIGHTQPRRIAAHSVASRIAEELDRPLGEFVGYKMRFNDKTADDTVIKLMTDGILLTELSRDRYLNQYEVLIIDEAHERSLNIDFLLGILKNILPRRPDLKLIITSATIDPEKFSNYFGGAKKAPIIEVSGRTYPVEMRYRPLLEMDGGKDSDEKDLNEGIIDAVRELSQEGRGDILVFLSGEREIREAADELRREFASYYEILPLFSRLGQAEQSRIFRPGNRPRIVLSTNVAETSLTVPGIKYVIDSGVARISRYNPTSRLQSLLVEPIARASADQRAGRCGRVSEGICIRLFSEEDFESRPEFLDPEILRTHLASVILQMGHLRLGDPEAFPFIEAPETRQIREGFRTLRELRAVRHNGTLTRLGNDLARLPIDPRFGAMLLDGVKRGVGHELLVLVAMMSIQDPRERPLEFQQQADEKHRLFKEPHSDFISFLNLWTWYQSYAVNSSQSQLRKLCRQYFLNFMRMREWYDLYRQIEGLLKSMKLSINPFPTVKKEVSKNRRGTGKSNSKSNKNSENDEFRFPSFSEDLIHQSLLVGLLDQIGMIGDDKTYTGPNNRKFKIFPGSFLFKKPPKWVMAMEIVETSQVYARTCGVIDPAWLESIADHLIKKQYSEPHWSKTQGQAAAYETLLLFGLPVVANRQISYGKVAPELSRELMIREGLVEGEINIRAPFYRKNSKVIEDVELMEEKTRRRDILVEEWQLFEWYTKRIPADCYSVAALEKWCKTPSNNDSLILTKADILARDDALNLEDFPETVQFNQLTLNALYLFDPSNESDGMTLLVPLAALNLLDKTRLDWLVRGLIEEKVVEIMRTMPRALRRNFVPLPNVAAEMVERLEFGEGNLYYQIADFLTKRSGITIEPHNFNEEALPRHLRMNIRVIDTGGKTLGESRDLNELRETFKAKAASAFQTLVEKGKPKVKVRKTRGKSGEEYGAHHHQAGAQNASDTHLPDHDTALDPNSWALEKSVSFNRNGIQLMGYPALVLKKDQLKMELCDREAVAEQKHLTTLIELSLNALSEQIKYLRRQWPQFGKLALMFRPVGSEEALREDLMRAVIKDGFEANELPRDAKTFNNIVERLRREIVKNATDLSGLIIDIFERYKTVRETLNTLHPMNKAMIEREIKTHLDRLIYVDFISQTPREWRLQIPRYLEAMAIRVERFPQNVNRDKAQHAVLESHWQNYQKAREFFKNREELYGAVEEYRWMIEEMAVSFFAQPMKTVITVSEKRLKKAWEAIELVIKNSDYR